MKKNRDPFFSVGIFPFIRFTTYMVNIYSNVLPIPMVGNSGRGIRCFYIIRSYIWEYYFGGDLKVLLIYRYDCYYTIGSSRIMISNTYTYQTSRIYTTINTG